MTTKNRHNNGCGQDVKTNREPEEGEEFMLQPLDTTSWRTQPSYTEQGPSTLMCCQREGLPHQCLQCEAHKTLDRCLICREGDNLQGRPQRFWCCRFCYVCPRRVNDNHCRHVCTQRALRDETDCPREDSTWRCRICDEPDDHCSHHCAYLREKFGYITGIFIIIGFLLYIVDVVSDIRLAVVYFSTDHIKSAVMTAVFVFIPGMSASFFSVYFWYKRGLLSSSSLRNSLSTVVRIMSAMFLVSPLVWMCDILYWWIYWNRTQTYAKWDGEILRSVRCKRYIFAGTGWLDEHLMAAAMSVLIHNQLPFPSFTIWMSQNRVQLMKEYDNLPKLVEACGYNDKVLAYFLERIASLDSDTGESNDEVHQHETQLARDALAQWATMLLDTSRPDNNRITERINNNLNMMKDRLQEMTRWIDPLDVHQARIQDFGEGDTVQNYLKSTLFAAYLQDCIQGAALRDSCLAIMSNTLSSIVYFMRNSFSMYDNHRQILSKIQTIEGFLESAPQMLLQLYIVTLSWSEGPSELSGQQAFSIITSWLSLSWTMVSLYISMHPTVHMKLPAKLVLAASHAFTIGPRMLSMALFASIYPWALFIFCALQFVVMLIYHSIRSYRRRKQLIKEGKKPVSCRRTFLGSILVAATYIFSFNPHLAFFKMKSDDTYNPTLHHYIFYYALMYLENATLVGIWYHHYYASESPPWPAIVAMVMVFGGFILGLVFMAVYYMYLHHARVDILPHRHRWLYNKSPCCWSSFGCLLGCNFYYKCQTHRKDSHILYNGGYIANPVYPISTEHCAGEDTALR